MPVFAVAASSTFIISQTIHGWRPTSLTVQPASIATTARTPVLAATRRNHRLRGMSRRNIQLAHHQRVSRNSRVPRPTMMSHARCVTLTVRFVGRSSAGISLRPMTTVDVPVLGSDRIEARPGMGIPPVTSPSASRWPKRISGTSLLVSVTISIAANFAGCSL